MAGLAGRQETGTDFLFAMPVGQATGTEFFFAEPAGQETGTDFFFAAGRPGLLKSLRESPPDPLPGRPGDGYGLFSRPAAHAFSNT